MSTNDFVLTDDEVAEITAATMNNLAARQQSKVAAVVANTDSTADLYRMVAAAEKQKRAAQAPQYRPPTAAEVEDFTLATSDTGKLWEAAGVISRLQRGG